MGLVVGGRGLEEGPAAAGVVGAVDGRGTGSGGKGDFSNMDTNSKMSGREVVAALFFGEEER